jgi:hypothetical protein
VPVCVDSGTFSVEAAATTLTEDSDPFQVQPGPEVRVDNMDDSQAVPPTSVEDEDTSGDIVNELSVLAEVKLPSRTRKFSFHCFCNLKASNST